MPSQYWVLHKEPAIHKAYAIRTASRKRGLSRPEGAVGINRYIGVYIKE